MHVQQLFVNDTAVVRRVRVRLVGTMHAMRFRFRLDDGGGDDGRRRRSSAAVARLGSGGARGVGRAERPRRGAAASRRRRQRQLAAPLGVVVVVVLNRRRDARLAAGRITWPRTCLLHVPRDLLIIGGLRGVVDLRPFDVVLVRAVLRLGGGRLAGDSPQDLSFDGRLGSVLVVVVTVAVGGGRARQQPLGVAQRRRVRVGGRRDAGAGGVEVRADDAATATALTSSATHVRVAQHAPQPLSYGHTNMHTQHS